MRAQNTDLSSDEAFEKYQSITALMEQSFSERDMKTFRRSSFTDKQLQSYLSNHFRRLDLLTNIEGHHSLKLDSYLHSGNWFREIGFPKESIKYYNAFFDYHKRYASELTNGERAKYVDMLSYAHSILAENYAKVGLLDSAALEHKANMTYTKSLDYIYYPSAINNYGLYFLWYKKDLKTALHHFETAYDMLKSKFPDHTLIGSVRDNIADVYIETNRLSAAYDLYKTNFEFYKTAINEKTLQPDVQRLINAGAQLITTGVKLNQLEDAQETLTQLERIMETDTTGVSKNENAVIPYLDAKERLQFAQNKTLEAYETVKASKSFSDSLREISNAADKKWREELNDITLDRVALNFEIDRIQKESELKKQRSKLWISGLISSFFIVLLLFLFLSRRQHLVNAKNKQLIAEHEYENATLKVSQLNTEIESKKRDLSDFAITLTQNQEWTNHLSEKLQQIKQVSGAEKTNLLQELDIEISNKITFDEDTKAFFERLEKLSDAFFSKLTEQFPNLSKNEIRLCSLIRLKIESRSIATLQNITLASLNTSRYRLRKKLNLQEHTDLDVFIQNL